MVIDLDEARYQHEADRQERLREERRPAEIQNAGTSLSYPGTAVTGAAVQRVGVAFQYVKPELDELVDHNAWTSSELEVIRTGQRLIFRATLFGWHPFHELERVAVVGFGDRHYLAMKAAQQTWTDYLGELFVNELAGAGEEERGAQIIEFPVRTPIEAFAA
ncbi:MAG: hypothetical protein ACXVRH_14250 [Thermoleophilaceae bacterium]